MKKEVEVKKRRNPGKAGTLTDCILDGIMEWVGKEFYAMRRKKGMGPDCK